jgi:hypothetical protein
MDIGFAGISIQRQQDLVAELCIIAALIQEGYQMKQHFW